MIWGGRQYDDEYKPWFAWRPVILYGPMEWNRMRFDDRRARVVWLQTVWRMRCEPRTYYALPEDDE
jgi:hypothetical protein